MTISAYVKMNCNSIFECGAALEFLGGSRWPHGGDRLVGRTSTGVTNTSVIIVIVTINGNDYNLIDKRYMIIRDVDERKT